MIDARNVKKAIKYKAKAIPFKAKALNTPRYLINIPGNIYRLLSSGINMKLLVLIIILYSIADTEFITQQWASTTAILTISIYFFSNKHTYIFLNTKLTALQCNTSLTVYYLMQIIEIMFSVQKPTIYIWICLGP